MLVLSETLCHRRHHVPRTYAVHSNTLPGVIKRHCSRKVDCPCFRCRIRCQSTVSKQTCCACGGDDGALALFPHLRDGRSSEVEKTAKVGGDDGVEYRNVVIHDCSEGGETRGVVEDDVQAPKVPDACFHGSFAICHGGDVALVEACVVVTEALEDVTLEKIGDEDFRTFLHEELTGIRSQSRCAASHEGDFVRKAIGAHFAYL